MRDEARRFNAAAARLAVEDLARDPSYDAVRHRAAVEALAARRDWAVAHLNPTNADGRAEAVALVEGYRAALLANPRLDADQILCVRRHLANSIWPTNTHGMVGGSDGPPHTKRALSRDLGLLGLNAHNHMDLRRTGFTNEIAVISNLRATPAFTTLYRPSDTSIVRDIDLDFDASRILFTSFRGTNYLLGVYEVELNGEIVKSPACAGFKSRPSGALNGLNGEMVKSAASQPLNSTEQDLMGAKRPFKGGEAANLKGEARFNNLKPEGRFNNLKPEGRFNNLKPEGRFNNLKGEARFNNLTNLTLKGWPMDILQAANAQLGAIDQIAPVTTKTLILGAGTSMTFRRIPAGTFIMGSTNGYPDEVSRVVRIDKPFWLSEMEVDNAQYHTFDPKHDSRSQDQWGFDQVMPGHIGNHRRQPVVRVSREEAAAFCAWLSTNCNVRAALPTEEQWEWAARAGTDTPFPWGGLDDDFGKYANFADKSTRWMYSAWDGAASIQVRRPYKADMNYPLRDDRFEDDWFTLNFTGRTRCNLWGLYDMHGNAAEWTSTTTSDGRAVVRGGSFASRPKDATSSFKTYYLPWQKVYDVGFRVLLED